MFFRCIPRRRGWAGIAILAAAAVCVAQPVHPHHRRAHERKVQARAANTNTASAGNQDAAQPLKLLSPMEQPPQPATITLSGGKLAVKADNSSLTQILDQLGKSSGMTISGLSRDQRVFGDYGPGDPSQILSELLEGTGYNVLMTGLTREGTPRNLVLSTQGNAPPSSPDSFPQQQNYAQPFYQRQASPTPPGPPAGNMNFPVRSPSHMYQQMMQQRQQEQQPH
jgi:hypothetical protein